eukprot:jgi/Ulvmu1/2265/UM013_0112.1
MPAVRRSLAAFALVALWPGIASSVFTYTFLFFNFLSTASSPLITQALARSDTESARTTVGNAITLALLLGVACVVLLEGSTKTIIEIVAGTGKVDDSPTIRIAISYLKVRALGIPFSLVSTAISGAFRGLLNTRRPLIVAVIANCFNFCLDLVFIFGYAPANIPAFGAPGAAAATVVAEITAAALLLRSLAGTPLFPSKLGFPGFAAVQEFAVAGSAVLLRTAALQTTLLFATAIVARQLEQGGGGVHVAAHQVTLQTWFFLSYLLDALAIAANGLVADGLGRSDGAAARRAALRCLGYAGITAAVVAAPLALAPHGAAAIFTTSKEVQDAAAPALVIVAAMQPFNALAFVGDGVFQGAKDFQYLAAAMAVACAAAAAVMVSGDGSVRSVWVGLAVLQALRGAAIVVRYADWVPGFGGSPLSLKTAAAMLPGDAAAAEAEAGEERVEQSLLPPEQDE